MFELLFSPFQIDGLTLKNRVTMAPMYVGFADAGGEVNQMVVDHYREMAASGLGMVVVENAAVDPKGLGSPFILRADQDRFISGLARVAEAIKGEGAAAFQQINHVGFYAFTPEKEAPSPIDLGQGQPPAEMTSDDIRRVIDNFGSAAARVKKAGFDGVEIHGGTGYLIDQFLSPLTNQRTDEYGGDLEGRMRFGLEAYQAVRDAVGPDYPVGYRLLAAELMPGGLDLPESSVFAQKLHDLGAAYLSVMAGTHMASVLPENKETAKKEGYMVEYAAAIKQAVPNAAVIAAGRIQWPQMAEDIIRGGQADLIGLARVLFTDPFWPKKAAAGKIDRIKPCEPNCSLCMKRIMSGRPAYCSQWPKTHRDAFLAKLGEKEEEAEA